MPTDLTTSSRFTYIYASWDNDGNRPDDISFRTTTDDGGTKIDAYDVTIYDSPAADSHLGILRAIYASDDGFLDADGNALTPIVEGFPHSDDVTVEEFSEWGGFNPFSQAEYDGWRGKDKAGGALTREGTYSEDAETGRPRIESPIDDVPVKRVPGGSTYDYSLGNWTAMIASDKVTFRVTWTEDDDLETNADVSDNLDTVAFLAWLESIRVSGTGTAVGEFSDGVTEAIGGLRDYRFEQGTGLDDVDVQIESYALILLNSYYRTLSFTFEKVSGETGSFDIEAIRDLIDTTVTIPVDEDTPIEAPERGATDVAQLLERAIFPDGYELFVKGNRMVMRHPTLGDFPLDGDTIRAVNYSDLEEISAGIKKMPNDGAHVIHFGPEETGDGIVRFRTLDDQLQNDGVDERYRVHNTNTTYQVTVEDMDEGDLIILLPDEQCEFQVGLAKDGSGGEILAVDPPLRTITYGRGQAMPTLEDSDSYGLTGETHQYRTLLWPGSAIVFINREAFLNGTDPTGPIVSNISTITLASGWDIQGSFQILKPGLVDIDLLYRIQINVPDGESALGALAIGNGPSIWVSEGGTGPLLRKRFYGLLELGGDGDEQDYILTYRARHTANTRFVFLHRVPASSTIEGTDADNNAYDNWNHVDQVFLSCDVELKPLIRKVI